jgi:hypothetical protein
MKKNILVAGDLAFDYNLAQLPGEKLANYQLLPTTVLSKRAGNAWFLEDLVQLACSDILHAVSIYGPKFADEDEFQSKHGYAQAYSIWSPFERVLRSKKRVWRIENFLGCQPLEDELKSEYDVPNGSKIDLLILDDENLGFRNSEGLWREVLGISDSSTEIIFKSTAPLAEGALWGELFSKYADRLVVILSVDHLRAQNAALSEALSWDLAIEELDREFKEGLLAKEVARAKHAVIYYKGAGIASYKHGELDRFIYHPEELEGIWHARRAGKTFGDLSILAAAITRHYVDPLTYPFFVAGARALVAIRASHDIGGGEVKGPNIEELVNSFNIKAANSDIENSLHPAAGLALKKPLPESEYRTAFPGKLIDKGDGGMQEGLQSDLLQDFTGEGYEYVASKAMQVVLDGVDKALASVPKARYGAYLTVDREEIERINEIRRLIVAYQANDKDRKPLSIAVFGPPGSGKSFAIKQLAKELFDPRQEPLEFNLSQFASREELHHAFQQVRDSSVRGYIPLVFWDEFDADNLKWLKEFLAPMQDSEFRSGSLAHPFGKAIFVFAGGTSSDFKSFESSACATKAAKGPDFVSRLRGYVNIKGPNPQQQQTDIGEERAAEQDLAHLIRRAILLRSIIERYHPRLVDPAARRSSISTSVIRGFLRVDEYYHGARSLEAIVSMSNLADSDFFGVAKLPSSNLLNLHVSPSFMDQVREAEIESETVEILAEACHQAWREKKESEGYKHGEERSDKKKTHPLLVEYRALMETDKEENRMTARVTRAKLLEIGYEIRPFSDGEKIKESPQHFTEDERDILIRKEHDIWMRDHLLEGYVYAEETNESLRLHRDIRPFNNVPKKDKELDVAIVDSMITAIEQGGYRLVKTTKEPIAG